MGGVDRWLLAVIIPKLETFPALFSSLLHGRPSSPFITSTNRPECLNSIGSSLCYPAGSGESPRDPAALRPRCGLPHGRGGGTMPREIITIQVGQCGNQVGCRFWDMALREHAAAAAAAAGGGSNNRGGPAGPPPARFDEPLSTFFRNVDSRSDPPRDLPVGDGRGPIRTLKARAVLVDMEEGVVSEMLRGPLADLFDARQVRLEAADPVSARGP